MPTSPAMQPAHASFVALNPPPAASSSSRTITPAPPAPNSFEEWVRANMGVPSVFAPPEPAPEPEAAPSPPSDEEERERRRAALRVTELASSPELEPSSAVSSSKSSSPTTTPPSTAPAPAHAPKRTPLQQLADAAEQAPLPVPRPSASQKAPAPAPAPPLAPAPTPAPAPPAILGPKPKSPSPTPQHIPLFTCPDLTAAASSSTPPDPLAEITMLASTFVAMRKSFTFPDRLDFSTLSAPPTPDGDVKLPVCARNLAVHAYEHALSKILGRLEGVGNVRARGVREKRKDAVKDVKDEMERVRKEVSRRARESWGR
ncbi:hypothetical protein EXIGLDRAFT_727706 [Exidia glandulosa HHB12029]|uniref:BAG domain-containing protein n=1 Tax=Exidia glandulosa HHB12029 TaxID=1314781 RepID=A0A165D8S6_EXIGL|nr:hypothetical protein EXIGLDRAFT_727706 [Exidia glandulosa HHB12029]